MKKDNLELDDELLPEYDLKSLRIRKLGSGRKSFGTGDGCGGDVSPCSCRQWSVAITNSDLPTSSR
jgi:hypothetical protein